MNTKVTPQAETQEKPTIPLSNSTQRNGHLLNEKLVTSAINKYRKSESTDTFEMQTIAHQRPTIEAFEELEHLVPNGVPGRADIVEMSSLLYDDDDGGSGEIDNSSITTKRTMRPCHSTQT